MSEKEKDTPIEIFDYLPDIGNPTQETFYYKIGGTVYEVRTNCQGSETLMNKILRLLRSESIRT